MHRRTLVRVVAVALLVVWAAAGCGGDDDDAGSSTTTAGQGTEAETPAGSAAETDAEDLPRRATVSWGDQERTFALVICENPDAGTLLVSGSDDDGFVVIFDVSDGSGTVTVTEPDTLEGVFSAQVEGFAVGEEGELEASGTGTAGEDYEVTGTCGAAPGS